MQRAAAERGESGTEDGAGVDEVALAMTFPLLQLPAPTEGSRGKLVPVDLRAHYLQSARRAGRPIAFDVLSLVQQSEAAAMSAGGAPPPLAVDVNDFSAWFDFVYDAERDE